MKYSIVAKFRGLKSSTKALLVMVTSISIIVFGVVVNLKYFLLSLLFLSGALLTFGLLTVIFRGITDKFEDMKYEREKEERRRKADEDYEKRQLEIKMKLEIQRAKFGYKEPPPYEVETTYGSGSPSPF